MNHVAWIIFTNECLTRESQEVLEWRRAYYCHFIFRELDFYYRHYPENMYSAFGCGI